MVRVRSDVNHKLNGNLCGGKNSRLFCGVNYLVVVESQFYNWVLKGR